MIDRVRTEYISKIKEAKKQLETAGTIHRRDLSRQINRMEKELRIYDKYHASARR